MSQPQLPFGKPAGTVIVRHLVTFDSEEGHPMDVAATVVEVDAEGNPTPATLERLMERVVRDIRSKATKGRV